MELTSSAYRDTSDSDSRGLNDLQVKVCWFSQEPEQTVSVQEAFQLIIAKYVNAIFYKFWVFYYLKTQNLVCYNPLHWFVVKIQCLLTNFPVTLSGKALFRSWFALWNVWNSWGIGRCCCIWCNSKRALYGVWLVQVKYIKKAALCVIPVKSRTFVSLDLPNVLLINSDRNIFPGVVVVWHGLVWELWVFPLCRAVLGSVQTAPQPLLMLMPQMCSQWTPAYPGEELEQVKKTLFVR